MTCLTNYEIKTWICPVYIIGQKWNQCQRFQPFVILLKLNDDKYDTGTEKC